MIVLLFILVLAYSANAMVVELVSPSGEIPNPTFPLSISCTVSDVSADEILSNLTLYFKNNESTAWHADSIEESMPGGGTKIFSVSSLINATYEWNCLAISNKTNEGGEGNQETWDSSNNTFVITFTTAAPPASDVTPPSCSQSNTNITVEEDSGSWTLDSNMSLDTNISCTDTNALTYTISQTGSGGTFSLTNNDVLNFATDANATGTKIAVISVSDGTNTVHVSAQVVVSAVNDPPVASLIPNQNWNENANKTIDLGDYFSDVDDSSLNYSYVFNSSSTYITAVIDDDGDALLTPEIDWYGSEIITFTAYDSANLSFTSNEVTLTVQETNQTDVNERPSIDTFSPESDPTISVGESQTFSITKSDPDGDDMNVTWYIDNDLQEGETSDSFTYAASVKGSYIIKVAISDGKLSDSNSWALTVGQAQVTTNRTTSTGDEGELENETSACGDGDCSENENQSESCYKDCGCPVLGYVYDEAKGKCIREGKSGNLILLIVVVGLFLGGAGFALYFYKKKQEEDIFGGLANVPFELPPKEVKVGPKIQVGPKKKEIKPQEPKKVVEESVRKPVEKHQTTSQVLLKKYIIDNLKKGKSLEQIKDELRKVGWTSEQVDEAYTAAQLDEAFS